VIHFSPKKVTFVGFFSRDLVLLNGKKSGHVF
jgi:hypothetical protein